MRVKITLTEQARESAIRARKLRGIDTPDNFEGPDFTDVIDVNIDSGFVFVMLEGGTVYGYPVSTVARLAQYD